jgi:hypothetical protein
VTTSLGAEGLGAVTGEHLLVADGPADFAAAVARVLDDPALAARLGAAGRALVEARFDWETVAAAHDEVYERVLRDPGPPPASPVMRDGALARVLGRLGWAPPLAAGIALVGLRGARWYLAGGRGAYQRRGPLVDERAAA